MSGPRRRHLRRPLPHGQAPAAPNHRHMTACARDRASRLDSRARAMNSAAEPQDGGALTLGRERAPAWGPEAALSLHSGVLSWPRPQFSGRRCSSRKKGRKRKKGRGGRRRRRHSSSGRHGCRHSVLISVCAADEQGGRGERRKSCAWDRRPWWLGGQVERHGGERPPAAAAPPNPDRKS